MGYPNETVCFVEAKTAGEILLVGPDEAGCSLLCDGLEAAGYRCQQAARSTEAGEILTAGRIDLLIVRMERLPPADAEVVWRWAESPDVPPILMLTQEPELATAMRAVASRRIVGYQLQPTNTAELLPALREAIDDQQIRNLVRQRRRQLETVLEDLRHLELATAHGRLRPCQGTLDTYLSILSEHMVTAMRDLRALVEVIAAREDAEHSQRRLAGARPFLLLDALRETVAVLEKTKTSFKSRELADLRRKLEALLAG